MYLNPSQWASVYKIRTWDAALIVIIVICAYSVTALFADSYNYLLKFHILHTQLLSSQIDEGHPSALIE